jgi:hypothetical protein
MELFITKNMKHFYIVICYLVIMCGFAESCSNTKTEKIVLELYASPKSYSCSLLFNNGIFNYTLNKRDVIESKEDCCFGYSDQSKDSVVSMCYRHFIIEKSMYDSLFNFDDNIQDSFFISPPCALFLIKKENNKLDTIFIDRGLNIKYDKKVFRASKKFDAFFYRMLTPELKQNWVQ